MCWGQAGGVAEALDYLCGSYFRSPCSISLCAVSPEPLQLPSAAGTVVEGGLVGCRGFCWGYFGCFPGSSSEAGVCLDFSIPARLETATPMTALLTITSQQPGHLLVSLCIRDGCFCVTAEGHPAPGVMPHLLTLGKNSLRTGPLSVGCWHHWHSQLSMLSVRAPHLMVLAASSHTTYLLFCIPVM